MWKEPICKYANIGGILSFTIEFLNEHYLLLFPSFFLSFLKTNASANTFEYDDKPSQKNVIDYHNLTDYCKASIFEIKYVKLNMYYGHSQMKNNWKLNYNICGT